MPVVDLAIVTSNFPAGKMHHLKQLDLEAATLDKVVRDAQGSTVSVKQPEDCADLQASLSRHRAKMHHYGMHCNPVLGLCLIKKDGSKYFIDELVFAALLRPFSVMNGGDTEFIFLTACTSHGYGMRLKQMGFVVVCWLTRVNDDAAQPFATAFYKARVKNNASWQAAFDCAVEEIESQNFQLVDPDIVKTKNAAGIPKLLIP